MRRIYEDGHRQFQIHSKTQTKFGGRARDNYLYYKQPKNMVDQEQLSQSSSIEMASLETMQQLLPPVLLSQEA